MTAFGGSGDAPKGKKDHHKGKGAAANNGNAAAQIKTLSIVEETKSAYDDFLADLKMLEKELESTK